MIDNLVSATIAVIVNALFVSAYGISTFVGYLMPNQFLFK